jgi:hypothetical protein
MLVRADFIAIEWSGWAARRRSGLGSSSQARRRHNGTPPHVELPNRSLHLAQGVEGPAGT